MTHTRPINPPWTQTKPKPKPYPAGLHCESRDGLHLIFLLRPDREVYAYMYDDANVDAAVSMMGAHAANLDLSLGWPEADVMAMRAREMSYEATKQKLRRWLSNAFRRFWKGH